MFLLWRDDIKGLRLWSLPGWVRGVSHKENVSTGTNRMELEKISLKSINCFGHKLSLKTWRKLLWVFFYFSVIDKTFRHVRLNPRNLHWHQQVCSIQKRASLFQLSKSLAGTWLWRDSSNAASPLEADNEIRDKKSDIKLILMYFPPRISNQLKENFCNH